MPSLPIARPDPETAAPGAPLAVLTAASEAETRALAARLAARVRDGDLLLLSGDLGSGKTAFARALIQALQAPHGPVEEVPSPSFTLVQTYGAGGLEIAHADLYRLSDAAELDELGLESGTGLILVEWPERAAGHWPATAVWLVFTDLGPGTRRIALHGAPAAAAARRLLPGFEAP